MSNVFCQSVVRSEDQSSPGLLNTLSCNVPYRDLLLPFADWRTGLCEARGPLTLHELGKREACLSCQMFKKLEKRHFSAVTFFFSCANRMCMIFVVTMPTTCKYCALASRSLHPLKVTVHWHSVPNIPSRRLLGFVAFDTVSGVVKPCKKNCASEGNLS